MKISSLQKKTKKQRERRQKRVRQPILLAKKNLRLTVFRSHRYIYAQIIDDQKKKTLLAVSDQKIKEKKKKQERAEQVGLELAKLAGQKKIKQVVFDRGWYRYQGRVKHLAEAARKGGLKF